MQTPEKGAMDAQGRMPEILTHRGLPAPTSRVSLRFGREGCSLLIPLPPLVHLSKEPESRLRDTMCPVALSPGSLPLEAPDQEHFRDITVYSLSNKLKHLMKTLVLCSE